MYQTVSAYRSPAASGLTAGETEAFLGRVYRWMAVGLGITGVTAMLVASSPAMIALIFGTPLYFGLFIAQLLMVMAFSPLVNRVSAVTAGVMFAAYAALTGMTLSVIFLRYQAGSIATTFFITAGSFAGLSAFGLLTRRSLASWGSFLFMGLFGIVLASVVNIFLGSGMLQWVLSLASVLVFTGLIAYDTQRLKDLAPVAGPNGAINGALLLYLDFINLFLSLLRLFGSRRD
jgi:FtsH-binding integral membrane protein